MPRSKFNWKLVIVILFAICYWQLDIYSLAQAKEYDGLWFLGFNLKNEVPAKLEIRKAVAHALPLDNIVTKIISAEVVPGSIIPPGMDGYDKDLKPRKLDLKLAKGLIKKSGIEIKKLKTLTLLHTDGIKTVKTAELIRNDLRHIGIKLQLVQIDYADQKKWSKALSSGEYDFFLMGYKAFEEGGSAGFLKGLFASKGEANFSFYKNQKVDQILNQAKTITTQKLKEINQIVYNDLPVVGIFYITTL